MARRPRLFTPEILYHVILTANGYEPLVQVVQNVPIVPTVHVFIGVGSFTFDITGFRDKSP
jgi:hypothetical protein